MTSENIYLMITIVIIIISTFGLVSIANSKMSKRRKTWWIIFWVFFNIITSIIWFIVRKR